jgi:hypothetical protein
MVNHEERLEEAVLTRLLRLNAMVYGWVTGIVAGLALFVATNWLLIKGGPIGPEGEPVIGPHLWLLSQYLIGYKVTFWGSLVGFAYGLVLGFAVGYFAAQVYNWLVALRERQVRTPG